MPLCHICSFPWVTLSLPAPFAAEVIASHWLGQIIFTCPCVVWYLPGPGSHYINLPLSQLKSWLVTDWIRWYLPAPVSYDTYMPLCHICSLPWVTLYLPASFAAEVIGSHWFGQMISTCPCVVWYLPAKGSHYIYLPPFTAEGRVDKKAMIRNRYNRIPHPAPNTKWERDTYN